MKEREWGFLECLKPLEKRNRFTFEVKWNFLFRFKIYLIRVENIKIFLLSEIDSL